MKQYTEEDLRKAFRAGSENGIDNYNSNGMYTLDEDEYIGKLSKEIEEESKITFSWAFLRRKLEWTEFCDLTGIDYYATREGYEIKDTDTFEVTEQKAKEFNLI